MSDYASAQANNDNVIKFTTNKSAGSRVQLTINSKDGFTIEGVEESAKEGYSGYTLKGSEVKIYGNVEYFSSPYNEINSIDVTAMPTLQTLDVFGNPIETIDVSKNSKMNYMVLGGTNITSLDLKSCPSLENLNINSCKIESLDLTGSKNLKMILAKQAGFKSLDLTGAEKLDILDCSFNKLGKLDLSPVPALTQLACAGNDLEELDLSNVSLLVLNCNMNNLKSIDLSGQTDLEEFGGIGNQFGTIDFSSCELLFGAMVCSNKIYDSGMTSMCSTMPEVSGAPGYFTVVDLSNDKEENECSVSNVKLMEEKNWETYDYQGGFSGYDYGVIYEGIPDEVLGIEDARANDFTVHADINSSRVYVAGVEAGSEIRIFDIQGKLVKSINAGSDVTIIDTDAMQNGVYFVSANNQSVKFVVR